MEGVRRAFGRDARQYARERRRAMLADRHSFILAVTIRLYIRAARSPPRSEPQNNQDLRPKAMPRTPRSAALFDRQMRPSSRNRVGRRHAPSKSGAPPGSVTVFSPRRERHEAATGFRDLN